RSEVLRRDEHKLTIRPQKEPQQVLLVADLLDQSFEISRRDHRLERYGLPVVIEDERIEFAQVGPIAPYRYLSRSRVEETVLTDGRARLPEFHGHVPPSQSEA